MKLKTLLKGIDGCQVKGSRDIEITGLCSHSEVVAPGNLFVAKRGNTFDGHHFAGDAVAAGAVAVLTDIYDPFLKNVTQVVCANVAHLEGLLAAKYYQYPSDDLFVVGVTGTNGKTTTATLVKHILDALDQPCGLIGTLEYMVGDHRYNAHLTTPDVTTNQKMLREMVLHGCQAAVMEVCSHGLHQGRVEMIHYDAAIFTNLSLDHLDYHGSMENYCSAKNLLFRKLGEKKHSEVAIVNEDDPWHTNILEDCHAPVMTYGFDAKAQVRASSIQFIEYKTEFLVFFDGKQQNFQWDLIGQHNVYNGLAAIALGLSKGVSLEQLAEIMVTAPGVAGRLERVPNALGLNIYVDYAHTPHALESVLASLRSAHQGKIITVFGCGGKRDASKRPEMARVSERLSDFSVVTSDNPRTEDPHAICCQIAEGFSDQSYYLLEADRRKAIGQAIDMADIGDTIIIAGKGHETRQIFAHQVIDFDDRVVAKEYCDIKTLRCVRL